MSLIDSLRNWGESLFNSKKAFIVQQTYLDYSKNVVIRNDTINTAENIAYVAPGDGVIVSYLNDKTSINGIMTTLSSMSLVNFGAVTGAASTATFAPVKKGESVTIFTKTFDYANRVVRYIPYLGGGLKSILQVLYGGTLCLRLKNALSQFLSSQARKRTQTETYFKLTARLVATSHQAMALFCSGLRQLKDEAHLSMPGGRFPSQATARQNVLHGLQSRVLKAKLFNGHTAEQLTFTHLPHQKAQANLATGGAL